MILRNQSFDSVDDIAAVFSSDYYDRFAERTYRPVATLSYFIDHRLWNASPVGAHAFNVVLHALAAVAVFYLLAAMGIAPWWAFAGAFLFGVHPVKTEAVALASNREEILCGLFFFAAFALHLRGGARGRVAATVCFLLALFSKEMAASFPLVLFAYHFYVTDREKPFIKLLKDRLPEYLPYVAGVLLLLGFHYLWLANPGGGADWPGGGGWRTFSIMSYVFIRYFLLLAVPARLCADYVIDAGNNVIVPAAILFVIMMIAIAGAAVRARRKTHASEPIGDVAACNSIFFAGWSAVLGFAASFFLLSLLPVSNIIPFGETMAERYLYIPSFAFAFLAAALLERLPRPHTAAVCAAAFGILFCVLTPLRLAAWQSDLSFWQDTTACAPRSAEAHMNLANAYLKAGDIENAMEQYALVPGSEQTGDEFKYRYNLGLAYRALGDIEMARESFLAAVELKPDFVEPMYHLADLYAARGDYERGLAYIQKALASDPDRPQSYFIAGQYIIKNSEDAAALKQAVEWLEQAVALEPGSAVYHGALGQAYLRLGNMKRSESELLESIKLDPSSTASYHLLYSIYKRTGRAEAAAGIYEKIKSLGTPASR